ncbi:hypothetical protein [Arthrobacter sp. Hiyo1]|uniref:hypothetical protein n=1 Tax=Arthrobacter sp. Hiyo1 TaxID=1588020 RepID=UPI00209BF7C0|nr:hypothetical protein [Arthrobacter sp. Hiyo1]
MLQSPQGEYTVAPVYDIPSQWSTGTRRSRWASAARRAESPVSTSLPGPRSSA